MKNSPLLAVCLLVVLLLSYYSTSLAADKVNMLEQDLTKILHKELKKDASVPGAILYVNAPHLDLSFAKAAGFSDVETHEPLALQQPIRFASNTKTFVAVTILRLWEDGKLELDTPITSYILPASTAILQSGGYKPATITVRHLLTHTSGLFDYAESKPFDKAILKNPRRRWTRAEQLAGAIRWGSPISNAGKAFKYSDTGYILLGEIIEQVTKKPLAQAVRDIVNYNTLGMKKTWWETLEPKPSGLLKRAHQYWGKEDSYSWDPSFDLYGGGGLVGTLDDLARFMQALFTGKIYRYPSTLTLMLTGDEPTNRSDSAPIFIKRKNRKGYGMGIRVRTTSKMIGYEHGGVWGTIASYFPEQGATIVVVATQLESKAKRKIMKRAAKLLRKATQR